MASEAKITFSRIAVETEPPVARIRLNHPPQNVIDIPMMEELLAVLEEAAQRADVSVIVFSGSEKTFSAGVDVAAHTKERIREMLGKFHSVVRAIAHSQKVTLAAVRGNCLGGGAELPLVCDIVFTGEGAKWGFPEIQLACYPPVAAAALAALVGQKRAADLVLTGRVITGHEAAQIGLATAVVPDEKLDARVEETLERLSKLSPGALKIAKKAFYVWDAAHFDKGLARAEQIYFDELMATEDAIEGIRAFMEKRRPVWKGK